MGNYAVITPVRNEQAYIAKTVGSVTSQSIKPGRWVIVDDGSTDNTGTIVEAAAATHSWIRVVHRADRGFRQSGAGIVEAFYDGFACLDGFAWDFLVKLDGDLSFDPDYFEKCFAEFGRDARLGIGGGTICISVSGISVVETPSDPAFHVRGATKIYRRGCWDAIGGLVLAPGWDTIDEVKANMLGWHTRTFKSIQLIQHRATGRADALWKDWVKNGRANYMTGYHPLFMLLKCLKRAWSKPFSMAATGLLWGFVSAYLQRVPRAADADLQRYVRQEQINRLLLRPSLWS